MIFGYCGMPALGVKGAAIATVIGQCVAFILALIFNIKVNKEVNIRISKIFKPQLQEIIKIYEIGIPSIIMTSITTFLAIWSICICISSFRASNYSIWCIF